MRSTQNRSFNTLALTHYWGFKWLDAVRLNSFWIGAFYFLFVILILFGIESKQPLGRHSPF